jgi:hypothetical protein
MLEDEELITKQYIETGERTVLFSIRRGGIVLLLLVISLRMDFVALSVAFGANRQLLTVLFFLLCTGFMGG